MRAQVLKYSDMDAPAKMTDTKMALLSRLHAAEVRSASASHSTCALANYAPRSLTRRVCTARARAGAEYGDFDDPAKMTDTKMAFWSRLPVAKVSKTCVTYRTFTL